MLPEDPDIFLLEYGLLAAVWGISDKFRVNPSLDDLLLEVLIFQLNKLYCRGNIGKELGNKLTRILVQYKEHRFFMDTYDI